MRKAVYLLIALALAACSQETEAPPPAVADENTVRVTSAGEIIGLVTEAGAHAWRGIPYAAPPVGDLRWRAPRPAEAWDGVMDATEFGERCPQVTNFLNAGEGLDPGLFIGSEDCLTLDIYAPPDAMENAAAGRNLPVMVWIHGGGNVWGRSSSYDGSNLALNENVVIVAVQYRIGPLGWFSHAGLRESAETPRDLSANFGTLDLVASLEWVRENIAAFGGDPENVTIFGESAGGHNVVTLLASPPAAGLFDRAIIQSGSFDSVSVQEAEEGGETIVNPSAEIVARLGAEDAAALRATPVRSLFTAYGTEDGLLDLPRIIEDGVALPAGAMREAFASTETFNAVPIITGTNRDELKLFHIGDPGLTRRLLGVFVVPRDREFYNAVSDYPSLYWRIIAVDEPAEMMAAGGHDKVYAYRFDWDEGGRFLFTDLKTLLGAAHAMEIPFVFNRFELLGSLDRIMFRKKTAPAREELSRAMGGYWAAFARDGAPSGGGRDLIDWPRWSDGGGSLMVFDTPTNGAGDSGLRVIRDVATRAELIDELKDDPRLDQAERCRVAEAFKVWRDDFDNKVAQELGCPAG